jgi:hypothetical protein
MAVKTPFGSRIRRRRAYNFMVLTARSKPHVMRPEGVSKLDFSKKTWSSRT